MIIEITLDTEFEPDQERVEKILKALGYEQEKLTVKPCAICEPLKKRRGRPPKGNDIYTLAREKTARRNA